jgi:hypothetical protein
VKVLDVCAAVVVEESVVAVLDKGLELWLVGGRSWLGPEGVEGCHR